MAAHTGSIRCQRWFLFLLAFLATTTFFATNCSGQEMPPDTVTVWNSNTKKSQSYRGRIVSYDASELKLQLASGREQSLPSAQITDITSRWHDDYVKAEDFVQQRRFERASISYKQALTAETRLWVKHRITCLLYTSPSPRDS